MEKLYQDLTADQVKEFVATNREESYRLIDVRFPEEYTEEHLPGAILMPLDELEERIAEIPVDKDLVVYCLSGKRSVAASLQIGSIGGRKGRVYNMLGGILAWKGMCLPDMPDIKVFGCSGSKEELLYQAMNLEKGAHRFYEQVLATFGSTAGLKAIETLVNAEEVHARMIYGFWEKLQDNPPPFEEVYALLPGDILEGGKSMAELTASLIEAEARCTHIIAMAMSIEFAAYDLYRTMAHLHRKTELEEPFLLLSQSEKSHMRIAAEALALCSE